jgi:hypothetical protein
MGRYAGPSGGQAGLGLLAAALILTHHSLSAGLDEYIPAQPAALPADSRPVIGNWGNGSKYLGLANGAGRFK